MNPFLFLENLSKLQGYAGQIAHVRYIPPEDAVYSDPQQPLSNAVSGYLRVYGVERLYSHQASALDAVRSGKNIAVVTRTASGKTLCYNLPVLERLLSNHSATALYLFPTKALAQDQSGKLEKFGLPPRMVIGAYDGDTSQTERAFLRKNGRIVLTNPDMLHMGILPRHTSWGRFFRRLEFVVVDELHHYRGVFGSHVGCVLRRLRRICRHYGADPIFIFTSATIANPRELAFSLCGAQTEVIDNDGSPHGPRKFMFWNPPVIGNDGTRRSAHAEATSLLTGLVESGIRCITFTKARRSAELILRYARQQISENSPELTRRIMSYRAGYRPKERRDIEQKLFNGKLLGVIATEALELGVDVGGLDAVVLTGYPGTISSTWQQAGRAGRGRDEALSVLVGLADPLDQYLMTHPDYFFDRGHEQVLLNPGNPYILTQHIACAAHECPIALDELPAFGEDATNLAWGMAAEDMLGFRDGRFYWLPNEYPAARVNIRSASADIYRIVTETGALVGDVESARAFKEVHQGAIYLHGGDTYRVRKLDLIAKEAIVEKGEFHYYTKTAEEVDLRVLDTEESYPLGAVKTYVGRVEVTNRVVSYRKLELFTEGVQGVEPLDLPEQVYQTDALWWTIPHELVRKLEDDGFELMGSIHAIEHAAIGLVPLLASCDRWDVGGISHPYHLDTGGLAAIFIYDGYPGGVGIARACYVRLKRLLTDTLELLLECPCESGCPSCVQSPKCGNNNEPLDKAGALRLLSLILKDAAAGP